MGKQAYERKKRSKDLLKRLAAEDSDRFKIEWNKRMHSWITAIWASAKDEAVFTEKEYEEFVSRFPHAHEIIAPLLRDKGHWVIFLERLKNYHEEELGTEALTELLKHVKGGTLKGCAMFDIVKKTHDMLIECGVEREFIKYALENTRKLLGFECCRALAASFDKNIYKTNTIWIHND